MIFADRANVSGTHRTRDGYLAADVKIARTGVQIYSGAEVGKPEMASVRVYRPADAVFAPAAMSSAAHKPITVDHPAGAVDASRWKELAVGWTGDAVARDGDFLRVSMMVADHAAIAGVESGAREVSCGYSCGLEWTPGRSPTGEQYDAVQRGISINHVAIVPAGRAGSACRIGDAALGDRAMLFDAAGQPATLYDAQTGQPKKLNADLIQAIEAEAARLGLSVKIYLNQVAGYVSHSTALQGK